MIALVAASQLVAWRAVAAQAPIAVGVLRAPPDCGVATDTVVARRAVDSTSVATPCAPVRTVRRRSALPVFFYGALAAGVAANTIVRVDQDPGGYDDAWATTSSFPDKAVHGLAAFALTSVGVDMKVSPWRSAAVVCAAGTAFEFTQGYVSLHDIAADCVGAGAAALWRSWRAGR